MAVNIQHRRGTAAQWTSANTVLLVGEIGVETDTGQFKIGDGSTAWASLGYSGGGEPAITSAEKTYTIPGTLTTGVGVLRMYFTRSATITNIWASVATAPTGASLIFDVNKNGTTIFTNQSNRPTIPISGFVDISAIPDVVSFTSGDYITVDVDQIGSTVAGDSAVIAIEYEETVP